MSGETQLAKAREILSAWTIEAVQPEPERLDIRLEKEHLLEASTALSDNHWGYLSVITGVDLGEEAGQIEVLYTFCKGAAVTNLRVLVDRKDAVVPSICSAIPSASFFERELQEMLGVKCEGTPDPSRLFLPDDWPDGVYPLRKDFSLEQLEPKEEG